MAEIIKTAALAVSVCVLCAVIKQYRPEYAPIVQIAAVAVIAASAVRILQNIISQLDFFSGMSETGGECISVLIKALGVAVAAQIAGDICRDNGNSAVAGVSPARLSNHCMVRRTGLTNQHPPGCWSQTPPESHLSPHFVGGIKGGNSL